MTAIGFVGAGLIGNERMKAFATLVNEGRRLRAVGVVDPYLAEAASRAAKIGAPILDSVVALIAAQPDIVVIAVPHDSAPTLTTALLESGIRVLLEKPMGRTFSEATALAAKRRYPDQLLIGHNYRFFKGVSRLLEDLRRGIFGEPISLSLLLGHGGSPNDVKGWKLDPRRAGGGCMLDPGTHLLDLACQAEGGPLEVLSGHTWSGFWSQGIEEHCHVLLSGTIIPTIQIEVSIVRWRSTFRIELFGTEGYGLLEGRGRSYGPQTYRRGFRWGWRSGRSQVESEELVVTTSGEEVFADELRALLYPAEQHGATVATADETLQTMELLRRCRLKIGLTEGIE
jgi:predicted dehydrogenase